MTAQLYIIRKNKDCSWVKVVLEFYSTGFTIHSYLHHNTEQITVTINLRVALSEQSLSDQIVS